eukprot:Blabericola_migrator_1__6796@NODE_343_length_9585_cov_71_071023_g276_i0_p6_GENE_NODE_343_length_9585_cov_71_071023_g276_i0NODE_343_length_9585_cov_71_071023_g276_i0_p6_ORF_typecomplete_len175_score41_08_NODE_343_length_9585_cov_71_071023_g276_i082268750
MRGLQCEGGVKAVGVMTVMGVAMVAASAPTTDVPAKAYRQIQKLVGAVGRASDQLTSTIDKQLEVEPKCLELVTKPVSQFVSLSPYTDASDLQGAAFDDNVLKLMRYDKQKWRYVITGRGGSEAYTVGDIGQSGVCDVSTQTSRVCEEATGVSEAATQTTRDRGVQTRRRGFFL